MTRRPNRPETPIDRMRADRDARETELSKEQMQIDELHAAVFDTPRGSELIAYWDLILLQRPTSPELSDGALRGLEHTRNFFRMIKVRNARFHEKGSPRAD